VFDATLLLMVFMASIKEITKIIHDNGGQFIWMAQI
jgi:hypothetical protein